MTTLTANAYGNGEKRLWDMQNKIIGAVGAVLLTMACGAYALNMTDHARIEALATKADTHAGENDRRITRNEERFARIEEMFKAQTDKMTEMKLMIERLERRQGR